MINYNTKFQEGQNVRVIKGYYKGKVGKITNYMPQAPYGMSFDNAQRRITDARGVYTVRFSLFKSVYVEECNLMETIFKK